MSDINFAGYIDDTGKRFVGDFQSEGHVGPPGYTPQKGVDYFTSEDVEEVKDLVKTETGCEVEMTLDPTTYILTVKLITSDGTILNTETVDLPIEAMIVNGTYDSSTKEIVLTLQSGSVIRVPIGDLISGLQEEITVGNKLSSDLVDDTGNTNRFMKSISADTTMYGLSAGIYQTIGTVTLKYANTRTFQSKNGILIISEYNKIKSFVEASDGALHTGVIDIGTGYCKTSDLTEKLINNISAYVKDSLDYSTSGIDYALSAYQGYLLNQNKQDKLTAGSNIDISGSTIAVSGIENGAEVNIIEEVQVDGTPLEVTNKAVNIVGMAELKAEYEQLLNAQPTNTATGETINVNDSSNLPIKDIKISGSGKNLLNEAYLRTATYSSSTYKYTQIDLPKDTTLYFKAYLKQGKTDISGLTIALSTVGSNPNLGTSVYPILNGTIRAEANKSFSNNIYFSFYPASVNVADIFDTYSFMVSTESGQAYELYKIVTGNNTIILDSGNLFDQDNVTFTTGVLDDNGNPTGSTASHYTNQFYSVAPNKQFTIQGTLKVSTSQARLYFYDSQKQWISRTAQFNTIPYTFTTPANCYYIRIQVDVAVTLKTNDVQLEVGSTATAYKPYQTPQQVTLPLGSTQLTPLDTIQEVNNTWCINETPIVDTALITALEQVEAMTTYKTTTNAFTLTVSDNATPTLVMEYRQDLETLINNFDARLSLLE